MKRTVAADEVINKISEILLRADGETIEDVAEVVGISAKYEGDSMFSIEE